MLQTMITGSLPRPTWLVPPNQMYVQWKLDGSALEEGQDDAVQLALLDQDEAGMDIVTDGEQRRRHYIWGFLEGLEGIDFSRLVKIPTRGGRSGTTIDAARVIGPIRRRGSSLREGVTFLKKRTSKPIKVTLPGPMTCADTLADEYFHDRQVLATELAKVLNDEAHALAEAGADIVQFDEPCFNIYLDEVEAWGVRTLEQAAQGIRAKKAVHICYGYGGSSFVQKWKSTNTDWTHYGRSLPLLRTSAIDMISVECAASGVDPAVLGLAKGKDLMVGMIHVGIETIEAPEQIAARIRTALAYVEPQRLYPTTDCGMIMRTRAAARAKMKALAAGAAIVRAELESRN